MIVKAFLVVAMCMLLSLVNRLQPRNERSHLRQGRVGDRVFGGLVSLGRRLVSADGHPVPDIDGADSDQQPDDLVFVEEAGDVLPDRITHPSIVRSVPEIARCEFEGTRSRTMKE